MLDSLERIRFTLGEEAYKEECEKEELRIKEYYAGVERRRHENKIRFEQWKRSQDEFIEGLLSEPNPEFIRWVKKNYPKVKKPFS